ncbi:hypothetical protein RVIR1_00140 [Candidatus Rickettsiella viridis]|uniref:Uncharacterized protein n=1 Tax=Candidatus Rickettsiella viridis TaxID=676208 RepID=A0A2Z5V6S5_9COXI|nr:hypothetical protein [Candidatus Rickettsiella viridis]BBB14557.1 hypothetical protein RVIR1_00140 [Candidatus Rickettsiella viridis]
MFFKIIIKLMFLLVLLGGSLALNAETLPKNESFVSPGNFSSPRYFYTKCRDSSSLIRNSEEINTASPEIVGGLFACATYTEASLDWFLFSLRGVIGEDALGCYYNTTLKNLSSDELLSSVISFLNLNQVSLDMPGAYTPQIFFKTMLTKYPMPNECRKKVTTKKN